MSTAGFQPVLLPSGPQYAVPYVLTGPDGQRAVFNDDSDPDYVGVLTDISGFDSPEVRENADDLVEMDGGLHGDFFYGRRPITMEGQIMHDGDLATRGLMIAKLQRASSALRADATLVWTPDGGVEQFVNLRRQQPLRITGSWNKTFQLSMVASDPRIYSSLLHTNQVNASATSSSTGGLSFDMVFPLSFGQAVPTGQMYLINQGNAESFPIYYIYGPGTSPAVVNLTTGKTISLLYTLGSQDALIIDTRERTVRLSQRSGVDDIVNYVVAPVAKYGISTSVTSTWSLNDTLTSTAAANAPSGVGFAYQTVVGGSTSRSGSNGPTTQPGMAASRVDHLTPSQDYTFGTSIRQTAGAFARRLSLQLAWKRANNTLIRADSYTSAGTLNSTWTTRSWTVTAPDEAVWVTVSFMLEHDGTNYADGETYQFDSLLAVRGSIPFFAFGDTPGWAWRGIPGNSESYQPGTAINANTIVDRYSALDFVNTEWGGIVPGSNDVRLSYYSSQVPARILANYRDAWM